MILVPQEIPLYAGDLIEVEFEVVDTSEFALNQSVAQIKQDLSHDSRFRYQGSRWEDVLDLATDAVSHTSFFVILQVADPAKVVRQDTTEVQPLEAGVGGPAIKTVVVWLGTLIAAMYITSRVAGALEYRAVTVNNIVLSETMTDDQKQMALAAMNGSHASIGSTIDSVAKGVGGLGVLLALALLAYLVFGGHG